MTSSESSDPKGAEPSSGSKFGPQAIERLRTGFELSKHPMLIADDRRRWVTANTAACDLLRIPREDVPWHTMDEFAPPEERDRLEERWTDFLSNGAAEGWYHLFVPDLGAIPLEFSATANVLPGRHLSVFIPPDELFSDQATAALAAGETWRPVGAESAGRSQLTEREREVLTLVASGLQSADIASRLYLSPETIKSHVHNAMGRLGAHTRAHAVAIALVTGQITWDG